MEAEPATGVVVNCLSLKVLEAPIPDADALAVLSALDEVAVDLAKSNDTFYKVRTPDSIDGFCMKKFIVLR